jgi:hypothetical protein
VAPFEYPLALLLDLLAQAGLFRLGPFHPTSLPVDFVDVNDGQSRKLAEFLRQRAFPRSRLAHDHDPVHRAAPLASRAASAMVEAESSGLVGVE